MKKIIEDVLKHAEEEQPNECCGLIVKHNGRKKYIRCENKASDPTQRFVIDEVAYTEAVDAGELVMIAHSHVMRPPAPSQADLAGIEITALPWLIVNYPLGTHTLTHPSGFKAPLLEREFSKGRHDCYALVKDYYDQELGIELPEYDRPEDIVKDGKSILIENFEKFGFHEIALADMQVNDCLLMQVGAAAPNHVAVYVGDNHILHHVLDQLSSKDVYGQFWRKVTTHVLRYSA